MEPNTKADTGRHLAAGSQIVCAHTQSETSCAAGCHKLPIDIIVKTVYTIIYSLCNATIWGAYWFRRGFGKLG